MIQNPAIQGGGGVEIITGNVFEENAYDSDIMYFDGKNSNRITGGAIRGIRVVKNSLITFISEGPKTITSFTCEVRTPLCKISSTGEIEQRFRLN